MAPEAAMQIPAKPRRRPSFARPAPPARSSVAWIRPIAPRAKSIARTPARAATGTAQPASTRVTPARRFDTTTPAGTASTATPPSSAARDARWLLLRVRPANSCWWNRAPDDACDGDERQDVRECLEEHSGRVGVRGEPERECGRHAEEQGGRKRAEGAPVPEDQRGERDEPATRGHVLVERAHEADCEIRTAEGCEHAGYGHRRVADEIDGDADRLGSPRMLAHGADAEADRRLEHDDVRDDQKHEGQPDHQVQLPESGAEECHAFQARNVHVGDPRQVP